MYKYDFKYLGFIQLTKRRDGRFHGTQTASEAHTEWDNSKRQIPPQEKASDIRRVYTPRWWVGMGGVFLLHDS